MPTKLANSSLENTLSADQQGLQQQKKFCNPNCNFLPQGNAGAPPALPQFKSN
jgi:hypothetical protein